MVSFVGASHDQPIAEYIGLTHEQPIAEIPWTGASHDQPIAEYIGLTHIQPITELLFFGANHDQPITFIPGHFVGASHDQPIAEYIGLTHEQPISEAIFVAANHDQPIEELTALFVGADHDQPIAELIGANHDQPIRFAAETFVGADHDQPIDFPAGQFLGANHDQPILELAPVSQTLSGQVRVLLGGREIPWQDCSVEQSEGSPYWQADITLVDIDDMGRFTRDKPFTVEFYGTTYLFITDTRSLERGRDEQGRMQEQARITGLSPAALLASQRADAVSQTWDTATLAKAIVEALIGPVTWNLLNWPVPAYRFAINEQTPLEAAMQLISPDNGVGGVIVSEPDGSILVRKLYPVPVPDYETATPDIELTAYDITTWSESFSAQRYYNKFVIGDSDAESEQQDRMEFEADDDNGLVGTIRIYPSPWRTTIRLDTNRTGAQVLTAGQVRIRDVTEEEIEIKAGRVSLQYPVHAIRQLEYLNQNLGAVTFEGTEIITATPGYTLVTVTYATRSIDYRVRSTVEQRAQFKLENLNG